MQNLGQEVAELFNVKATKIPDEVWDKMDDNTKRLFIGDIIYAATGVVNKDDILKLCNHGIPAYAYRDNEAGVRLSNIIKSIETMLKASGK